MKTLLEIHRENIKELGVMEQRLIGLIAKTGDDELMETFTIWQDQRKLCNDSFAAILKDLGEPKKEKP